MPTRNSRNGSRSTQAASAGFALVLLHTIGSALGATAPDSGPGDPARGTPGAGAQATASGGSLTETSVSPGPSGQPREFPLLAEDGHAFLADYYASGESAPRPGVLLIPNLGQNRKSLGKFGQEMAGRGYGVLVMDNTGQTRNITKGKTGPPKFNNPEISNLKTLLLDVRPAGGLLRQQPGIDASSFGVVGVGIGGNLGLVYAAETAEVTAVAFVLPGFGCEGFDVLGLFEGLGRRRALLVNVRRPRDTDFARAFSAMATGQNSAVRERVQLSPTSKDPSEYDFSAHEGLDNTVLDWLDRNLRQPPPR